MIRMTRKLTFSAAYLPGPPGNPGAEPTGHTYHLAVSVDGPIDPRTGIVVNIKEIDHCVREAVLDRLQGRLLNSAVPEFAARLVTPETLVGAIAGMLRKRLPDGVELSVIALEPDPLTRAVWMAKEEQNVEEAGTVRMTRSYEFAASHRLHSEHLTDDENRELFGKCNYANGHGHNYVVEVTVSGPIDDRSGSVMLGEALDAIVEREILDRYDHRHLNHDIPELQGLVTSSEVLTKTIYDRLVSQIPAPARLVSVLVRETARNLFEYRGEKGLL